MQIKLIIFAKSLEKKFKIYYNKGVKITQNEILKQKSFKAQAVRNKK